MLKQLLTGLKAAGASHFVVSDDLGHYEHDDTKITFINDARSAAFYAFGESLKRDSIVYLIIPGNSLPSAYTAITEAWFQKVKIVILSIFKNRNDIKISYLERCVLKIVTCDNIEDGIDVALDDTIHYGPVLINIVVAHDAISKKYSYEEPLKLLENIGDKSIIFCYDRKNDGTEYKLDVRNMSSAERYGAVSKYVGFILGNKEAILCCAATHILLDTNIFRNRYSNPNMKIIIVDSDKSLAANNVDQWIESNGWNCKRVAKVTIEDIRGFVANPFSSVLILEGGC